MLFYYFSTSSQPQQVLIFVVGKSHPIPYLLHFSTWNSSVQHRLTAFQSFYRKQHILWLSKINIKNTISSANAALWIRIQWIKIRIRKLRITDPDLYYLSNIKEVYEKIQYCIIFNVYYRYRVSVTKIFLSGSKNGQVGSGSVINWPPGSGSVNQEYGSAFTNPITLVWRGIITIICP